MNTHHATLLNGFILISMGIWGYIASEYGSITALIPAFVGLLILLLSKGMKSENKAAEYIVYALTILILIALYRPFSSAMESDNSMAIFRILFMMAGCVIALMAYVKKYLRLRNKKG